MWPDWAKFLKFFAIHFLTQVAKMFHDFCGLLKTSVSIEKTTASTTFWATFETIGSLLKFQHLVTLIATFSRSAAGRSSTVRWSARRSGSSTTARSGSFLAGFTPMTSIRSTSRVSCKLRFPFLSPIKRFFNGPFRTSSWLTCFRSFQTIFRIKTLDFSGSRTRNVGVEGQHADH